MMHKQCNLECAEGIGKLELGKFTNRQKVDSYGACLTLLNTGVKLIIPPKAIPEGDVVEIGLDVNSNYSNVPHQDSTEGCIAPIITCLPNRYKFQGRVLIMFPHSVKQEDCPLQLYSSHAEPDEDKDWEEVKHNQDDDSTSPILFLKKKYGYLFVNSFTDYVIIPEPGKEICVKLMRIVVYANELADFQDFQEVHICCHGERDDLTTKVEREQKKEGRHQMTHKLNVELFRCDSSVKVNITAEDGWIRKTKKKEQTIKSLYRRDCGSCQYTFKNDDNLTVFHCQISVQQDGFDEVELEFTNRLKKPNLPTTQSSNVRPTIQASNVRPTVQASNVRPTTQTSLPIEPLSSLSLDRGDSGFAFQSECSLSQMPSSSRYNEESFCPSNTHIYYDKVPSQISSSHSDNVLPLVAPVLSPVKIPNSLRSKLCALLNPAVTDGNDWRKLASVIDHEDLIRLCERFPSPTECVIQAWEAKDEHLEKLVEHLKTCKRFGAAKLVEDYIKETNQNSNQLANTSTTMS
ncbi:netrin receptor UNC5B-a-like [Antedon mediterranea]|uniref:netrin receptor UNC5B-a-like n=1 Tax=Antedon mediterranea TaxID=105859 RepID=UPI003AF55AEB